MNVADQDSFITHRKAIIFYERCLVDVSTGFRGDQRYPQRKGFPKYKECEQVHKVQTGTGRFVYMFFFV